MTLRYYGAGRLASAISEDNSLAEYFAECVTAAEDFELLAPVELSISASATRRRGRASLSPRQTSRSAHESTPNWTN